MKFKPSIATGNWILFSVFLLFTAISASVNLFDNDFGGQFFAQAKDIEKGKLLYEKHGCIACHGVAGREAMADIYPRIDRQTKVYLVQQMQDIQSEARSNGASSLMRPSMKGLSQEEINLIATYLADD